MVRITGGNHAVLRGAHSDNGLPVFWMMALLHAREWISGATVSWMVKEILEQYSTSVEIRGMVDSWDMCARA